MLPVINSVFRGRVFSCPGLDTITLVGDVNLRRNIMNNTHTNKLAVAVLAVSLGFLSSSAFASKDDIQSRASAQIYKLQQQIKVAEANKQATKTAECKKLAEQSNKC